MSTSLAVKPVSSDKTIIDVPLSHNFFADMDALTRRISQRAFGLFQERGGRDGRDLDDWFRAEAEIFKPVPIELSEADSTYTINAEVPGFDAKDLTIQAEPNSIYIHGKVEQRKEEKKDKEIKYSEVSAREISRRIDLPVAIIPEKASARLTKGVLELSLPKAAPDKKLDVKITN